METTTQAANKPKPHILLTSLGTSARDTQYELNGYIKTAKLTPLALVKLLDESQLPNRVVAAITKGAERSKTWPIFQTEIKSTLGICPDLVSIPDGSNPAEIGRILEAVAKKIPEGADLTLDVTQGLRHFPFIFYALVLYLKSLREVTIRGAYYGMVEGFDPKDPTPRPIIDLQPLLDLPEWFYAVRMFREQGTTLPIADLIQPLAERLKKEKEELFKAEKRDKAKKREAQANQVEAPVDWLEKYAFALGLTQLG